MLLMSIYLYFPLSFTLKMQYANHYDFKIAFEDNEVELKKVQVDKYSYIHLLANMFKLFRFHNNCSWNGLSVEIDIDLILIFELYKDNNVILLRIISQFVPLRLPPSMRKSNVRGEGPSNTGSQKDNVVGKSEEKVIESDIRSDGIRLAGQVYRRGRGRSVPITGRGNFASRRGSSIYRRHTSFE